MVAKCGQFVVWHWARMPGSNCDPWWGSESEWHRKWKALLPEDWRETVHFDEQTGENHIADVKTPNAVVVEFQRSPITGEEVASGESFYQNMTWVIDGDRGSLDPNYFRMGLASEPISLNPLIHGVHRWSRGRLLDKWSTVTCPAYIDFGTHALWRPLEFEPSDRIALFSPIEPEWLVDSCTEGDGKIISRLPEEEREAWIEQFHLVEYSRHTYDSQS